MVLTLSKSDQYSSAQKEISKLLSMYMTGYFCRSVYIPGKWNQDIPAQILLNRDRLGLNRAKL